MKLIEHEMLVTVATMALKMDDLTPHDIIEAFRELGHRAVLDEAKRKLDEARRKAAVPGVSVHRKKR